MVDPKYLLLGGLGLALVVSSLLYGVGRGHHRVVPEFVPEWQAKWWPLWAIAAFVALSIQFLIAGSNDFLLHFVVLLAWIKCLRFAYRGWQARTNTVAR